MEDTYRSRERVYERNEDAVEVLRYALGDPIPRGRRQAGEARHESYEDRCCRSTLSR
jgi:hypothetical protein